MLRINWPEFITKISVYYSALILPLTIVKVPDPFQRIHPKFIRLNLVTRPGQKHCNIHSSLGLRHTRMRLFFPMMNLHSSENIIRFQSPKTFFLKVHTTRFYLLTTQRGYIWFFFVQPDYDIYYETNIFLKKICRFP